MNIKYHMFQYLRSSLSKHMNSPIKIFSDGKPSGLIFIEKLFNPDDQIGSRNQEIISVLQGGVSIIKLAYIPFDKLNNMPAFLVIYGFKNVLSKIDFPNHHEFTMAKDLLNDPIYKQYRESVMSSLKKNKLSGFVKISVGVFLAGIVSFALFFAYATSVKNRLLVANMQTPSAVVQQPVASQDQLDQSELLLLRDLVKDSGIPSTRQGSPFVAFLDPNCPSCQEFEKKMKAANWPFNPLVIPVSFKPGSEDVVAGVFCAKDPMKAWAETMAGKVSPPCEKGRIHAAKINGTFVAMRLTNTPTFISTSGKIFNGSSDIRELLKWVHENYPPQPQVAE